MKNLHATAASFAALALTASLATAAVAGLAQRLEDELPAVATVDAPVEATGGVGVDVPERLALAKDVAQGLDDVRSDDCRELDLYWLPGNTSGHL